jgi:hypothetical protein
VSATGAGASWHGNPQAVFLIVIAILGLLGGLALVFFDVRDQGFVSAYRTASICSSAVDSLSGNGCRFVGEANVLSTSTGAGHKTMVAFLALPGRTFSAFFPTGGEPDPVAIQAGGTAQAELWSGKVTRLAGKVTNDDPEEYPTSSLLEIAAFLGVLSLPLLVIGIWSAGSAPRAL